jgi:hypothetical protein
MGDLNSQGFSAGEQSAATLNLSRCRKWKLTHYPIGNRIKKAIPKNGFLN